MRAIYFHFTLRKPCSRSRWY